MDVYMYNVYSSCYNKDVMYMHNVHVYCIIMICTVYVVHVL